MNRISNLSIDSLMINHFMWLNVEKKELTQAKIKDREYELIADINNSIEENVAFLWVRLILEGLKVSPEEALVTIFDTESNIDECTVPPDEALEILKTEPNVWCCRQRLLRQLIVSLIRNTELFPAIEEYIEKIRKEGDMNVFNETC